jgi:HEAT repeat protein
VAPGVADSAAPGSAAGSGSAKEGTAGEEALARRMAAGALARTGDQAAIALLAELLEREPSESARLEISYHLARAGDARGTARLVAALTHRNLDHRHEAARWLARLGDQRAVPVLTAAMAYGQFRLQAAEVLAHVADPGAIKALEVIRGAPGASADEKARATIALGRVKRAGADELRALLNDKRYAEAAPVLLENGDAAARPILHLQLALEHFCVEAARALRRFGDDTDRADGLRTLLGALGGGGPTAQIRAAEAILVLAGPETWSERM